ncbi:MAG: Gx transporter family protein [Mariprofundales bacterium]|nr:Gx transporter family protein [Mariprofundales bacterium]
MPWRSDGNELAALKLRYRWLILLLLAAGLTVFESLLPSFGPWFKPGLANIVTLIALALLGARAAFTLALARVVIGSFFLGTLFTPTMVVSATAALVAAGTMVVLWRANIGLSLVGISLAAAIAHMVTQFMVVEWWIVQQPALFYLLPPLLLLAALTGWINGTLAQYVTRRLESCGYGNYSAPYRKSL